MSNGCRITLFSTGFVASRASQDWPCFVNFIRIRLKHAPEYIEYKSDATTSAPPDDLFWNPLLYELGKAEAFTDVCTLVKLNLIGRRKLQPQCERLFSYVKMVQGLYATKMNVDTLETQLRILMETPDDVRYLDVDAVVQEFNKKKARRPLHFPNQKQDAVNEFDARKKPGRKKNIKRLKPSKVKRVPLAQCQVAADGFRMAMTNTMSTPTIDSHEDWSSREWQPGNDWRQVDGADCWHGSEHGSDQIYQIDSDQGMPLSDGGLDGDIDASALNVTEEQSEHPIGGNEDDSEFIGAVAAKSVKGKVHMLVQWAAGDCSWEAHEGEWAECTHEDLLADSVLAGSKVIVWEQNGGSCGGIVKSFNAQVGLHEIDFGNEECENLEIHDMLSLRALKKWVLEGYQNNELFKKK